MQGTLKVELGPNDEMMEVDFSIDIFNTSFSYEYGSDAGTEYQYEVEIEINDVRDKQGKSHPELFEEAHDYIERCRERLIDENKDVG